MNINQSHNGSNRTPSTSTSNVNRYGHQLLLLVTLLSMLLLPYQTKAAVSLDTNGFNPNANSNVRTFAQQADGKVLIGGDFTTIDGTPRNYIARLNADGSLDTEFDPGTGANSQVLAIALQADGKVLISGFFTTIDGTARNYIARLNADGSLDTGFYPGSGADNLVYAIALQADGKVLISGDFTTINGTPRNRMARLNADGSLDTGFDPGTGPNSLVLAIAQQTDGKVLIGGFFTTINGTPRNRIARLNVDGSLDTGFDPGTGANSPVLAIAQQADGKVLISGFFTTINGTARNYIARLNFDGSLDTEFDPGTGANDAVYAIAQQADGKVVIGGNFTTINGVARNRIARLVTDEAALQTVSVSGGGSRVEWLRSGASPTLNRATFDYSESLEGPWTLLGDGQRVMGGWELTELSLPAESIGYIRARGYYPGGIYGGSTSIAESIRQFYMPTAEGESFCFAARTANNKVALICL